MKNNEELFKIFPNPAQNAVTVSYNSKEGIPVQVDFKDLLGKVIYTNFINSGTEYTIPLKDNGNGIYKLCITKDKELLFKTKLVNKISL